MPFGLEVELGVRAIVAQVPVCGARPPALAPTVENFEVIRNTVLNGAVGGGADVTTGPLPVVSADQLGTPWLLEPIQVFRWFIDCGGRHGTGWFNRVTRVLPATPLPFSPVLCARFLTPATLMLVGPDDEMTHASYAVARITGPKEWHDFAGGHFGLLHHPSALFDEAATIQSEFNARRLTP